jgi:hypothetical protein
MTGKIILDKLNKFDQYFKKWDKTLDLVQSKIDNEEDENEVLIYGPEYFINSRITELEKSAAFGILMRIKNYLSKDDYDPEYVKEMIEAHNGSAMYHGLHWVLCELTTDVDSITAEYIDSKLAHLNTLMDRTLSDIKKEYPKRFEPVT